MKDVIDEGGGSAGLLYEGKASTYEGGMRVPAIAWWPGTIKPNRICREVATSMDLFPTLLDLAKADIPADRPIDGHVITGLLTSEKQTKTNLLFYYDSDRLYAIRKGPWKAHFTTHRSYAPDAPEVHDPPLLYNIEVDPSEQYNLANRHPEIIEDLKRELQKHSNSIIKAPPQFDKLIDTGN